MAVINSNLVSLSTQLKLFNSQNTLSNAIARLSSGLRINSAKDDAAGQSISNRLRSQITGTNQAIKNINDGISITQTTEGALDEINNNLQRMRELSVQAANGSNSKADLNTIVNEIRNNIDEINRISTQTHFNNKQLLNKKQNLQLQIGPNDNDVLDINLDKINSTTLGVASLTYSSVEGALGSINQNMPDIYFYDFSKSAPTSRPPFTSPALDAFRFDALKSLYGDNTPVQELLTGDETTRMQQIENLKTKFMVSEVTIGGAATPFTNNGGTFMDSKGDLYVAVTLGDINNVEDKSRLSELGLEVGKTYFIELDAVKNTSFSADFSQAYLGFDIEGLNSSKLLLTEIESTPIAKIDNAISEIDKFRGDLGAMQNRLESAMNSLSIMSNNLSQAKSRITDADYAVEVSIMTKSQILQQAGMSTLTQANQTPRIILSLLG